MRQVYQKSIPLYALSFVILTLTANPSSAQEVKSGITPYGRVELDTVYSTRNTNPLDPTQFNGYATAAGKSSNSSSTFNPRFSVIGLRADRSQLDRSLSGVVEVDFYGQTDNAGNLPPRLRLANATYAVRGTSLTVGQDWTPVMALHPDLVDFGIMGYNGNLWQRVPQVTLRQKFGENFEGLITALRFERGLSAIGVERQARPFTGAAGGGSFEPPFSDPVKIPYFGTRLAYTGKGNLDGFLGAISAAYRYYRSAPPAVGDLPGLVTGGRDINSYLVGGEVVIPLGPVKFSGELAYGQALGVEWFRFGQDLNLGTGRPVRTLVGWGQLSYSPTKDYTFLAGYGFDNPRNADLDHTLPFVDTQYLLNQRTYLTVIHPIWASFNVAFEWNHQMTEWTTGQHFQGNNYMMSFWYSF